jgi:hypothetical protein
MAVVQNLVALDNTTAVALDPVTLSTNSVTGETRPNWHEANLYVQNVDTSAIVYLGDATVSSTSYGHRLSPNETINIKFVGAEDTVYAISSTTSRVAVLMVRQ